MLAYQQAFHTPVLPTVAAAASEEDGPSLSYEIWTGTGRTGSLVATGSFTGNALASRAIDWDAPGLSVGTQTLYLVVLDGECVGDESSFEVIIGLPSEAPPETEDEAFTGQFGPVVVRFRYERRTRNFGFLAALIGVIVDAEVTLDNFRPVPMDVKLTLLPENLPDDWQDAREYVSITREFLIAGEFVPYTVGLFRLNEPVANIRPNGDVVWTVTGFDLAGEIQDIKLVDAVTYASGTNIITAVRSLFNTYSYRHAFDDSDEVLTSDVPFPPGTSVLTIVNTLLDAMNMQPCFPNEFGIFESVARRDPATTPFIVHYGTTHEPRFILPPWSPTIQALSQPNRIAVVTEDPAQTLAAVVRLNNDPTSPMSIASRGYEDSKDIEGAHVVDDATRAAIADWHLQVAAARAVTSQLQTTMDPRRRNHEVYQLEIEDVEEHTRWLVFGWTLRLAPGAPMSHKLGKALPLALEDE